MGPSHLRQWHSNAGHENSGPYRTLCQTLYYIHAPLLVMVMVMQGIGGQAGTSTKASTARLAWMQLGDLRLESPKCLFADTGFELSAYSGCADCQTVSLSDCLTDCRLVGMSLSIRRHCLRALCILGVHCSTDCQTVRPSALSSIWL